MMSLRGVAAGSRNPLLLQRTMQPSFHLQRRSPQQCKNYNHHANNNNNNGPTTTSYSSFNNSHHHNQKYHHQYQQQQQQQQNQYHQNDIYSSNNNNRSKNSYQLSNPDEFGLRDLLINPAAYFWVGVFGISIYNIVQIPTEFKP